MKPVVVLAGAALACMIAAPASAVPLTFDLTGAYTASWMLDSNPEPDFIDGGYRFNLYDVNGRFPGASTPVADLIFYNQRFDGGLAIEDFFADSKALLVTTGPQIYGGTEEAPFFRPGTFQLADFYNANRYTLTISAAAPAVPEPATWAMMLVGLGAAGAAMRRRNKVAATVTFA